MSKACALELDEDFTTKLIPPISFESYNPDANKFTCRVALYIHGFGYHHLQITIWSFAIYVTLS